MAITAEFIGVYIAGIIITTATITVIGATITAITAIGETYRVAAVSKLARQGSQHTLRPFTFLQTRSRLRKLGALASNIAKLPTLLGSSVSFAIWKSKCGKWL
jgi:hypothetical protein